MHIACSFVLVLRSPTKTLCNNTLLKGNTNTKNYKRLLCWYFVHIDEHLNATRLQFRQPHSKGPIRSYRHPGNEVQFRCFLPTSGFHGFPRTYKRIKPFCTYPLFAMRAFGLRAANASNSSFCPELEQWLRETAAACWMPANSLISISLLHVNPWRNLTRSSQ